MIAGGLPAKYHGLVAPCRTARIAVLGALFIGCMAGCHGASPGSVEVRGVVSTHPENACRVSRGGTIPTALASVHLVFTDPSTGRTIEARTQPGSVRSDLARCLQTAAYSVALPRADRYVIQVEHYSAFGGLPLPVTVTFEQLRRDHFHLDLIADPGTGE